MRRRLDERETERADEKPVSDDVIRAGSQSGLGSPAGQEVDGVAISGDLRPGDDITVGEQAGPGAGGRINSGPAVRDFPPPGCRRTGLGATGDLMGHVPVPRSHLHPSRRSKELPTRSTDLSDHQSARIGGAHYGLGAQMSRSHAATTVQQTIPGGAASMPPHPLLELSHGQNGGENRRRTAQSKAASRGTGGPRRRGGLGGFRGENAGEDRCEPLDDVVTGTRSVHVADARRQPPRARRSPADIMPTGLDPDVAGGCDRVRNALAQRVSRCSVCLPQRAQNLAMLRRSGVFRRFFLVM